MQEGSLWGTLGVLPFTKSDNIKPGDTWGNEGKQECLGISDTAPNHPVCLKLRGPLGRELPGLKLEEPGLSGLETETQETGQKG